MNTFSVFVQFPPLWVNEAMLHELRVQHLALIDTLHLDLAHQGQGLIVLTGETGAGKSIILQAINLLTGGRGSSSWVRSESEQADIEALFSIDPENGPLNTLLNDHDLQDGGQVIFRRHLAKDGRSKMYVNDRSVTKKLAAELAALLVNIASQHDQQQLLDVRAHVDFLDSYGDLWERRQQFSDLYALWRKAHQLLRHLQEKEKGKEQQRDFLSFQLEEIKKIDPQAGEDEALLKERDQLKASGDLLQFMGNAGRMLDVLVSETLVDIKRNLEQAATLDGGLLSFAERLAATGYELEDLAALTARYLNELPTDTDRLEFISGRLAALKQLQRKYGPSLDEVLSFFEQVKREMDELEGMEHQIAQQTKEVAALAQRLRELAMALSQARQETAQRLADHMEEELSSLNFSQAIFQVSLRQVEDLTVEHMHAYGADEVEFLFSANPGELPKPLARIVSGGELSRLMLAMKCLLARRDKVDTVIFDEVDAGIGGQAAEAVARKISELSQHHQVFCITHLPQIAARADLHFLVRKEIVQGRTTTSIALLDQASRQAELARMLDGEEASAQTLAYVAELMGRKSKREVF